MWNNCNADSHKVRDDGGGLALASSVLLRTNSVAWMKQKMNDFQLRVYCQWDLFVFMKGKRIYFSGGNVFRLFLQMWSTWYANRKSTCSIIILEMETISQKREIKTKSAAISANICGAGSYQFAYLTMPNVRTWARCFVWYFTKRIYYHFYMSKNVRLYTLFCIRFNVVVLSTFIF